MWVAAFMLVSFLLIVCLFTLEDYQRREKYYKAYIEHQTAKAEVTDELISKVGQEVTLTGDFSSTGKPAAFIDYHENYPVYILDNRTPPYHEFSWAPYEPMNGKRVSVTGILHFIYSDPCPEPCSKQVAPNLFCFDAEKATIREVR